MSGVFQKNNTSAIPAVCCNRRRNVMATHSQPDNFARVGSNLMFHIAVCLFCLLSHRQLPAQHLDWRQFSLNEGLPSNEVNCLLQDKRGIIWAGTYQGVCYFNGNRFVQPVDTNVLVASSTLNLYEDPSGKIWFSHLPSYLYWVENDTVRPFTFNAALEAYQKKFGYLGAFARDESGAMRVAIDRGGYLSISPDGVLTPIRLKTSNYSFTEVDGKILEAQDTGLDFSPPEKKGSGKTISTEVFAWETGKPRSLGFFTWENLEKGISFRVWRFRNGDLLFCRRQTFFLVRDNKLIWQGQKDVYAADVYQDIDGSILLCSIAEGAIGLLRFASIADFQLDKYENLLPGHEAMSLLCDRQGGWWVSTRDAGIFYCKSPHLDIYDATDGLPSSNVMRISSGGTSVYAGFRPFDICRIPISGRGVAVLPKPPGNNFKELTALCFDTLTGKLWCGADLAFWEKNRWTFSEKASRLSTSPDNSVSAQFIKPDPAGKLFWASYRLDFASFDRLTGLVESFNVSKTRLFSVTPDPGGFLWVTTLNGLRIWRNGNFEPPPFDHPALRYPLRGLDLLPTSAGGGCIIRLKGAGLLIRNEKGVFTHLTTREGLLSNVYNNLYIAGDGSILACSNAGLNKLIHQADDTWRIEAITTKQGLPSNQVNDAAVIGQELWVATDKGLARFRIKTEPAPMHAPMLEFFEVNSRPVPYKENPRLLHNQNNISFQFFTPPIIVEGNIKYRYRLLPVEEAFAETQNRQVNFVSLQPGKYTFEVQSQNEDGQWGSASVWPFEIQPPWWATWWARLLLVALSICAVWLFVRYRLQTVRAEAAMRQKMTDLQTTALRAQMNPHFIFNCLASIQSFIAENDAKSATKYLARFARLVRLALHGSLDGTHSLAEELEMLESYLELEQLRFRKRFDFEIKVSEQFNVHEIQLPPMLAQPFVENAIIHGMKNKQQGGLIELSYALDAGNLVVSIRDNGPGFEGKESSAADQEAHKSVGMSLTQKRLAFLSGDAKTQHFQKETVFDADGNVAGACITLRIPVLT